MKKAGQVSYPNRPNSLMAHHHRQVEARTKYEIR